MALRSDYRRDFADRFLPRIAAAAEDAGFTSAGSAGVRRWEWVKHTSKTARAEILLSEMTGRDVRDGLDIHAYGAIYLDDIEQRLREGTERHSDAATLMASLRAWGSTFSRDSWYRLRWNTVPERQVEALIRDLRSFGAFATTIREVSDLSAARLARSRIRRHVTSGLAPDYTTTEVATVITQMNTATESIP
ncbi:hypothetical protein M3C61_06105 [Dermacoccus abyssi]|uniref:hypothetical protein n=1 Tax=Dermacoccus abyssi TaxID=322596 RepID=UPI0021A2BC69|nr:hypothetical protein [Dermacoccus abyssi]MCT1986597.1 hypothetical protein [Dermacoccus abyssi]